MSEAKPDPSAKTTLEELWHEAQALLDEVVRNSLRPWKRHQQADNVNRFKQRLSEKLLKDDKKLLRDFRQEAGLKTWLQKITRREVNRVLQREGRSVHLDDAPPEVFSQSPVQEEFLLQKERAQLLAEGLPKLPPRKRELAELALQGFSDEEIARKMRLKVDSVYRMKNVVVKKLRKLINGEGAKIIF